MQSLEPIISSSPELNLNAKIPTETKIVLRPELISESIAKGMLNRGHLMSAMSAFDRALQVNPKHRDSLKGLACVRSLLVAGGDLSHLCESGIEHILSMVMESDRGGADFVQSLAALAAVCFGNEAHSHATLIHSGLIDLLKKVLDECILAPTLCTVSLLFYLSGSEEFDIHAVAFGRHMKPVLKKYAADPNIVMQSSWLMANISYAGNDAVETLVGGGAVDALVEAWRNYHMDDEMVCIRVTNALSNLASCGSYALKTLRKSGVGELVERCITAHNTAAMKAFGEDTLRGF